MVTSRTPRWARVVLWLLVPVLALSAGVAALTSTDPGQAKLAHWREQLTGADQSANSPSASPASANSPSAGPSSISPAELPTPQAPADQPSGGAPRSLDPDKLAATLQPRLRLKALGPHVVAAVAPLAGGEPAFASGTDPAVPASTMKLLTATAALETMGPEKVFTTSVVRSGSHRITLVGGGDPYLASKPAPGSYPPRADVATLARLTAERLSGEGVGKVRLAYDAGLFEGPALNPHWPASYVGDAVVSPISALWVDEGRDAGGFARVGDPPARAAEVFAAALRRHGIKVSGTPRPASPAADAQAEPVVASVQSAPLAEIVAHVLDVSDNDAAEVLARHVGIASGGSGSIEGAQAGIATTLGALGVPLEGSALYDGSGLSRDDRLTSSALLTVLQVAASADHPELRPVISGLPVAGFTGSLQWRFGDAPMAARGLVRAKTGTLTGVHGLAGVATDRNGTDLAFVLIADNVAPEQALAARAALDRAAAALGACRCSN